MAPKLKAVAELGAVAANGNGWCVWAQLGLGLVATGPTHFGPAARSKAVADLVRARRASTRDEMQRVLRNMKDGSPCGRPHPVGETGPNAVEQPAATRARRSARPAIEGPGSGAAVAVGESGVATEK